jgi:phospholipase C
MTASTARRAVGAALVALAAVLVPGPGAAGGQVPTAARPSDTRTPIEHVVTVMQEGHTFDNYFGSYPGADGIPAGTCMPVSPPAPRPCVKPYRLGNRPLRDLTHNGLAFTTAQAGGRMDGFIRAQSRNGVIENQTMGTYRRADLPYYWNLAKSNVLFDQFFASAPGGSVPNHLAWIAGSAARTAAESTPPGGFDALPTIFDQLEAKGISWKFYVQNYDPKVTFRRAPGSGRGEQIARVPLLAYARYVDDPKLFSHIVPITEYFQDLQAGTLPAVSYIVPSGPSERSPTSVESGERFVQSLAGALTTSSSWSTSAFLLTYDSWGGYYDHVAPTGGQGFRVPTLLLSAYARRGVVDHTRLETASIPAFIQDNWGLGTPPAAVGSLRSAFDFDRAPRRAEIINSSALGAPLPAGRTGAVFWLYGGALVVAALTLGTLGWRSRRRTEIVLP